MKEAVITGAVAGILVLLLQDFAPRLGGGEFATIVRVVFAGVIGALGGILVHIIRR